MATQLKENPYMTQAEDTASTFAEKAEETATAIADKAQEMTSSLGRQAQEMTGNLAQQASDVEQMMRARFVEFEDQARTFVRQQPLMAVLGAVGIGYLMARMGSRASREDRR